MNKRHLAVTAATFALAAAGAQAVGTHQPPRVPTNIYTTGSQWITTPDGCSYSRTQAPGYPVQWVLILNPHHIGQPDAHKRCAPLLRD
ncbi:hypothetical protein OB2597_10651 [Pseudooceanicola batsensis HTCC2597]|uniref:Secreted protein n=1 Tax=Pseudooceanicola batsensis (strain ATCC BAA-863 / DSM 15984 / KCTC 12145 / HTCC2597) TaxID=252305 RepID=A3TVQ0_PSEBH|nr:hypothetical protein [Pseudooceanicola batsensis]EAQ03696.1 hypothetical protein OB2597_10651 [Pseudooceanicola batsensis HTCC2597]